MDKRYFAYTGFFVPPRRVATLDNRIKYNYNVNNKGVLPKGG